MSCISDIFDRLDIQHIREFLLHGAECTELSGKPYEVRIQEALRPAIDFISTKFPNEKEAEKITDEVFNYANETQNVYMEIGIQCGMILALQLLSNSKTKLVPDHN